MKDQNVDGSQLKAGSDQEMGVSTESHRLECHHGQELVSEQAER